MRGSDKLELALWALLMLLCVVGVGVTLWLADAMLRPFSN